MHPHSGIRDNHQRGKVVDYLKERMGAQGPAHAVVSGLPRACRA